MLPLRSFSMIFFSRNSFCEAFESSLRLANTFIICLSFSSGILCEDTSAKLCHFWLTWLWIIYFGTLLLLLSHQKQNTYSLDILFVGRTAKSSLLDKWSCVARTGAQISSLNPYFHPHWSNIDFDSLTHGLQKKVICL